METLIIPAGAENPTASVIVPQDGEDVTAARGNPGDGPVRPGFLSLLHKIVSMLRGKLSFKSITVDVAGEQVVAGPSPGRVACANLTATAAVTAQLGFFGAEVEAAEFDAIGGTGRADYEPNRIFFRNTTTGATGSNPPFGTVVANELRALGMPKAWGYVVTDGAGGFSVLTAQGATYGVKSALAAASYIEIELTTPMDSTNYCIQCNGVAGALTSMPVIPQIASTTKFRINTTGGVNPTATSCQFHFVIFGQQST